MQVITGNFDYKSLAIRAQVPLKRVSDSQMSELSDETPLRKQLLREMQKEGLRSFKYRT